MHPTEQGPYCVIFGVHVRVYIYILYTHAIQIYMDRIYFMV